MKYFTFLSLLFCLFLGTCVRAQVTVTITEDADAAMSPRLTAQEKAMLTQVSSAQLTAYLAALSALIDTDGGTINQAAERQLYALFDGEKQVTDDLAEIIPPGTIHLDEYLDRVEEYFKYEGLRIGLTRAEIIKVTGDEDHQRFQVTVRATKQSDLYYLPSGELEEGEKNIRLSFGLRVLADEPENAKILSISLPAAPPTAPYQQLLHLDLGFGAGTGLQSTDDRFSIAAGSDLSFGVGFLTNSLNAPSSPNKDLFLGGSLAVFRRSITGTLNDFTSTPAEPEFTVLADGVPIGGQTVERYGNDINVTEEQDLTGIRIAVGPALRIYNKAGLTAFVSV
ncbi:MAG: hypothetical protein AAF840_12820, partial [Bacteroidota bacterium]